MAQTRRGKGPKSAAKRRGKGPKSAAKPKKKPKNNRITPETASLQLTGYSAELTVKVDKLIAALPPGEARDKLIAERAEPNSNPQRYRRIILQFIMDNTEFAAKIIRLAREVMELFG